MLYAYTYKLGILYTHGTTCESRKCIDDITFSAMNQLKGKIRITSLLKTLGVLVIFIYHNTTIVGIYYMDTQHRM